MIMDFVMLNSANKRRNKQKNTIWYERWHYLTANRTKCLNSGFDMMRKAKIKLTEHLQWWNTIFVWVSKQFVQKTEIDKKEWIDKYIRRKYAEREGDKKMMKKIKKYIFIFLWMKYF